MKYPRRISTKLRGVFGFKKPHAYHFASQIMRATAMAGGDVRMNIIKATCDWCRKPFFMPDAGSRVNFVSLPEQDFRLDIGGFCWKCREFRCHDGSIWVDDQLDEQGKPVMRVWACETCGTPYTVDTLEAAANYLSPAARKAVVEKLTAILMGALDRQER